MRPGLRQIAEGAVKSSVCLQVTGHTSATGSAVLNDRLSALQAEYVMGRLQQDAPALNGHMLAKGAGAQANLVDLLDRRVEFEVIPACR